MRDNKAVHWRPRRAVQLAFAFLADAAQFTNGKVFVLGGDIDTIYAPTFPSIHLGTVLVIKLLVQPTECGREHGLRVEFIDSDGGQVIPELVVPFTPTVRLDQPHRPVGVGLTLQIQGLPLPRPGEYAFHILVDHFEMGVVPLAAVERPSPQENNPFSNVQGL